MKCRRSDLERPVEVGTQSDEGLADLEVFRSRLAREDWDGLREQAVEFARGEIRKRKWRGLWGGVLPGCMDAEDIVDHAIGVLFEGKGRLGVGVGFTRRRVEEELERLIERRVSQLRRLKEARAVRSEWDVLEAGSSAKPLSVLTWVVDEGGLQQTAEREREEARRELYEQGKKRLQGEPELMAVFGCIWSGEKSAAEIGRKVGMEIREVRNARKRLERRLAGLTGEESCRLSL